VRRQRHATDPGIKADVRIADDHWILGEAIVSQCIVYDQRFVLEDSMEQKPMSRDVSLKSKP
jgi:hypothetical protein